jgi:hypothetical protein
VRFSIARIFLKAFWVGTSGLEYKLVTLTFGGARHQLLAHTLSTRISSCHARSVHASVPDAHASVPYTHDQHVLTALFKFVIFTRMLSIHVRN